MKSCNNKILNKTFFLLKTHYIIFLLGIEFKISEFICYLNLM